MSFEFETFQFHTGSIKRGGNGGITESLKSFNSILVRLKGNRRWISRDIQVCFNSILVRLKDGERTQKSGFWQVSIPYWFD